jgi:hypothetical protein
VISKYIWIDKCMVFIALCRIATTTIASLTYTSPPFNTTYGSNAGSSPTVSSWARPVLLSWQRTSVLNLYASFVHEAVSMIRTTFISKTCLLIRLWTSVMFDKVSDKFSRHLFIHPYIFGLAQPPVQWVMKSLSPGVKDSRVCSWLTSI